MLPENRIYLSTREEWRKWLQKHHQSATEIWLIYYKKHTGKPRVAYDEAVEEALCFGWIDSLIKRIDDETFCQKFTPRKDNSTWSDINKKRVLKLQKQGLMSAAGVKAVEAGKKSGEWHKKSKVVSEL